MAVYTLIDREELAQIVEDYGLGKLLVTDGITRGSVNTHYLLNTARGKFLLKIDEVKSVPGAIFVAKPYNPNKLCAVLAKMTAVVH